MILWGMGISQHVHGTDNARCLIALCLMTGQIGKPGIRAASAARPEQRAGRVRLGPDPDDVPGLPARGDPGGAGSASRSSGARRSIRSRGSPWSRSWTPRTTARSAACTSWARTRRCPTPTSTTRARRWRSWSTSSCRISSSPRPLSRRRGAAGDRVAGEGRHRHQHRPHGAARAARRSSRRARRSEDLWIIVRARRSGSASTGATRIRARSSTRCAGCMDSIAGITWERLERESSVTYPCEKEGDPGQPVVFTTHFPTATGRAQVRARRPDLRPPSGPTPSTRWC